MQKITKFRRSVRAISPVVSVLLLVAIAVVAALVAYAWVMGYIGGKTSQSGNAIQIQSFTSRGGYLTAYIQNVGQGAVHLKPNGSVYVNDSLYLINQSPAGTQPTDPIPLNAGNTAEIVSNYNTFVSGDFLRLKIVTSEGTFAQSSGIIGLGGSGSLLPVASFVFAPTSPSLGQSVFFTDVSAPGNGTINKWSWNFGDSATSSIQNPNHAYSALGSKTVTLTVTDTNGKTSTTTHTLTVTDYASPSARFIFSPTAPAIGQTVQFTDMSSAGSGAINKWSWNFGDSATSSAQNPNHSYSSSNQYTVTLTVTDSNSKTSTTTRTINVAYDAPTAQFIMSTSNANIGQTVSFTDTSIPGLTGTINQWSWNFGDGATSTSQNPTHSYAALGSKTITLIIVDTNGKTSTAINSLTVNDYVSPIASFTLMPTAPSVGDMVTFSDSSKAGSGTINQWSWNFGDGATGTSQNPTHSYAAQGQFTVSLMVTDSNSKTSTATQIVQVNAVLTPTPSPSPGPSSSPSPSPSSSPSPTPTSSPAPGQVQVTFAANPSQGGTVNPSGTQTFNTGATQQISATANSGYAFSSWTFSGPMLITNPSSASTSATINGAGAITANFISSTSNKLVFTQGAGQTLLINEPSQVITVQRQSSSGTAITSGSTTITLTATSGTFYSDAYGTAQITSITISSGSTASFYFEATATSTPTLTASATNYASISTTFTINTPSSITTPLNSNFDGSGSHWSDGWNNWANPPWNVATDYYFSAPDSVKTTQSNEGPFSCNPVDATGAKYITVTFEFMIYQTTSSQFQARYGGTVTDNYNSVNWKTLGANGASLGDTNTYGSMTWHQYSATITDTSAFTTNFRLSFLSQNLSSRGAIWVDNVVITVYK